MGSNEEQCFLCVERPGYQVVSICMDCVYSVVNQRDSCLDTNKVPVSGDKEFNASCSEENTLYEQTESNGAVLNTSRIMDNSTKTNISLCLRHASNDMSFDHKDLLSRKQMILEKMERLLKEFNDNQWFLNNDASKGNSTINHNKDEMKHIKEIVHRTTLQLRKLLADQEKLSHSFIGYHRDKKRRLVMSHNSNLVSALDDVNESIRITRQLLRKGRKTQQNTNTIKNSHNELIVDKGNMYGGNLGNGSNHDIGGYHGNDGNHGDGGNHGISGNHGHDDAGNHGDNRCGIYGENCGAKGDNLGDSCDADEKHCNADINDKGVLVPYSKAIPSERQLYAETFSFLKSLEGHVSEPVGVISNVDGLVYVCDYLDDCIQVINLVTGQLVNSLTHASTDTGRQVQFLCPAGLACDKRGNLFIAERGRQRITVTTPNGKLIFKFRQVPKDLTPLRDPHGVTVDATGRVIVTDTRNSRVIVYDRDGEFLFSFGDNGDYSLDYPTYAIFHKDFFYVSDTDNDAVKIFDKHGCYVRCLSLHSQGILSAPSGLAIYKENYILVCDYNNNCIKMFTLEGDFVTRFGCEGHGDGQFSGPEAVAVSKDNMIIVTDKHNSRVQVFS